MGFGNESDDDLIVIEDGPKKNVLPTDKEIDEKLRIWVDDEVQKGNDPKDMKLMVLLKVRDSRVALLANFETKIYGSTLEKIIISK